MIPVRVAGIAIDVRGQHVILLKPVADEPGAGKVLPIWIGAQESTSILVAIQGAEVPRPLSHDLMKKLLDAVDATVDRIEVTRLEESTFYAELVVRTQTGTHVIDCRPSDAIALGSRLGITIGVAEQVLDVAGVDDEFTSEENDIDDETTEFRRFLDAVDPSDFRTGSG